MRTARGPRGTKGLTGAQGPQGPAGTNGSSGSPGATGATGAPGTNGTNGADGRTWLSGSGAPSNAIGVNGDYYLDTSASAYYGPKAAGVWPSGVSLIGPQGPTGAAGTNGTNGTNGAAGATGATGAAGSALLNTGGTPWVYAANNSWTTTTKTTIATFTFTSGASGKARLSLAGNFSGGNGAWSDVGGEINGVAGTEKTQAMHFHTQGPRNSITIAYTYTGLTPSTLYTVTVSITPGSGTTTCNATSSPTTNWIQGEVREGT